MFHCHISLPEGSFFVCLVFWQQLFGVEHNHCVVRSQMVPNKNWRIPCFYKQAAAYSSFGSPGLIHQQLYTFHLILVCKTLGYLDSLTSAKFLDLEMARLAQKSHFYRLYFFNKDLEGHCLVRDQQGSTSPIIHRQEQGVDDLCFALQNLPWTRARVRAPVFQIPSDEEVLQVCFLGPNTSSPGVWKPRDGSFFLKRSL